MLSKQHLGADRRASLPLSRRRFLIGAAGFLVVQSRSWETGAAACGVASTSMTTLVAGPGTPPIVDTSGYAQLKDPSVAFDGTTWHLHGTGWKVGSLEPVIFHARADSAAGPFTMGEPSAIEGVSGSGVAAPGVVFEDGLFHLFVQTEFQVMSGRIEHAVSADGDRFTHTDTSLVADPMVGEAVIYDAQPCVIGGQRYLAYAAATKVGETELHLARSTGTWSGPWERLGPIVRQSHVALQNPISCPGYEWGLEGPQLIELPGGEVLLLGVCFLGGRGNGRQQRVFVAIAPGPLGPFEVLGVPFEPRFDLWARGENGHPGAVLIGDDVVVFYQGRHGPGEPWTLGTATIALDSIRR